MNLINEIQKLTEYMDFSFFNDMSNNYAISGKIIFILKKNEFHNIKIPRKIAQYISIIEINELGNNIQLLIEYNGTIDKDISINNSFENNLYIIANFINFILQKKEIDIKYDNTNEENIITHNNLCNIITYKDSLNYPSLKIFIKGNYIKYYFSIKTKNKKLYNYTNNINWNTIYNIKHKKILYNKFINTNVLLLTLENSKGFADGILNIHNFIKNEIK